MGQPRMITLKQAANLIQNGDMITFSGFTIWRRPMAFVYELVRQQKENLHLFEVNGGTQTEILAGAGCLSIWESCWSGHELYGKLGEMIAKAHLTKSIIIEDYSHAHLVARILAGATVCPSCPPPRPWALTYSTPILICCKKRACGMAKTPRFQEINLSCIMTRFTTWVILSWSRPPIPIGP